MSVNMIAASLRRFWDDTFLRFLFSFLADKSVTKPSLTNYLGCQPESCLFCSIRAFANVPSVLLPQMYDDDRVPSYEGDR